MRVPSMRSLGALHAAHLLVGTQSLEDEVTSMLHMHHVAIEASGEVRVQDEVLDEAALEPVEEAEDGREAQWARPRRRAGGLRAAVARAAVGRGVDGRLGGLRARDVALRARPAAVAHRDERERDQAAHDDHAAEHVFSQEEPST